MKEEQNFALSDLTYMELKRGLLTVQAVTP